MHFNTYLHVGKKKKYTSDIITQIIMLLNTFKDVKFINNGKLSNNCYQS